MLSFLKKYWTYLSMVLVSILLSIAYFCSDKVWFGVAWLILTMVWFIRLYRQYQRDKGKS